jgi:hypothetical protein
VAGFLDEGTAALNLACEGGEELQTDTYCRHCLGSESSGYLKGCNDLLDSGPAVARDVRGPHARWPRGGLDGIAENIIDNDVIVTAANRSLASRDLQPPIDCLIGFLPARPQSLSKFGKGGMINTVIASASLAFTCCAPLTSMSRTDIPPCVHWHKRPTSAG